MRRFLPAYAIALACFVPRLAHASCWLEAGQQYRVETALLKAIAWQESRGYPNAVGKLLPDGNVALGLMQINTIHLPALARYGIRREHLFEACTSQKVGAWVLADCIKRFGSTWKAVGCYYAGPASKNIPAQLEYVQSVQRYYAGYLRQEEAERAQQVARQAALATTEESASNTDHSATLVASTPKE